MGRHIAKKWREYGFDDVEIAEYDVLISSARQEMESKVVIYENDNVVFQSQSKEKVRLLNHLR